MTIISKIVSGNYSQADKEFDRMMNEMISSRSTQVNAAQSVKNSERKAQLIKKRLGSSSATSDLKRATQRQSGGAATTHLHTSGDKEIEHRSEGRAGSASKEGSRGAAMIRASNKAAADPRKQAKLRGTAAAAQNAVNKNNERQHAMQSHKDNAERLKNKYGNKKHFERALKEATEVFQALDEEGYDVNFEVLFLAVEALIVQEECGAQEDVKAAKKSADDGDMGAWKKSLEKATEKLSEARKDYTKLERHALAHKAHKEKAEKATTQKEKDYHFSKAADHSWAAVDTRKPQSEITQARKSGEEKVKAARLKRVQKHTTNSDEATSKGNFADTIKSIKARKKTEKALSKGSVTGKSKETD